jgi:hypothetical protein
VRADLVFGEMAKAVVVVVVVSQSELMDGREHRRSRKELAR